MLEFQPLLYSSLKKTIESGGNRNRGNVRDFALRRLSIASKLFQFERLAQNYNIPTFCLLITCLSVK